VTGTTLSMALMGVVGLALVVFLILVGWGRSVSSAVRWGLLSVIGGLVGYDLYAIGVPGALRARDISERWGALILCVMGCALTNLVAVLGQLLWRRMQQHRKS
jgi:hypothetical protein